MIYSNPSKVSSILYLSLFSLIRQGKTYNWTFDQIQNEARKQIGYVNVDAAKNLEVVPFLYLQEYDALFVLYSKERIFENELYEAHL